MNIFETSIADLYFIEGKRFTDLRGELIKPYSSDFMPKGFNLNIKEVWFTKSKKNVIRGMHLQVQPYASEKIICVIKGKIIDVILDLREGSKTYGQTFDTILSEEPIKALYIPKGCAHGYKVIEDSYVMYLGTEVNVESCDIGIKWDTFGYNWNIDNPILSNRDRNLIDFEYGKIKF